MRSFPELHDGSSEQAAGENTELIDRIQRSEWYRIASAVVALLLAGIFLGIGWQNRQMADTISAMQEQFTQFNEILKHPPQPLPAAPVKKKL